MWELAVCEDPFGDITEQEVRRGGAQNYWGYNKVIKIKRYMKKTA